MANDAAWLRQVFERQLPLSGYAVREEQQAMAGYVQTALLRGRHLLAEAGVGTGKTFAYLIPLLAFMRERQVPVLIATHTIALQEQLVERDIPAVARLLSLPAPTLLAKGRDHYLCKARLSAFRDRRPNPTPDEAKLLDWGQRTMTADRAQAPSVPDVLWANVSWGEGGPCAKACRQAANCPAAAVRRRWLQSDGVTVTNHHQLCADLVARAAGRAIFALPAAIVIDEAQALTDAARQILGARAKLKGLAQMALEALAHAGPRAPVGLPWISAAKELEAVLPGRVQWQLADEADRFGLELDEELLAVVRRVVEGGQKLLSHLEAKDARPARIDTAERLARTLPALVALLQPNNHVAWIEGDAALRRVSALVTVPRDPGAILKDRLWSRPAPVILTSATLAAGEDFGPLRRELGLETPAPLQCIAGSPFDYESQARLYLPTDLPDPGEDPDKFYTAATERLIELLAATKGRALVLYTSKQRAAEAYERLRAWDQVPILLQDRARPEVMARFVQEKSAVLLGTAYWAGLDVPGETLSAVVIVKLPFPPPEPVIEARLAMAKAAGLDPMEAIVIPEMLIRLKQGAGRAIRRETDRAIIAILDPRTARPRYAEAVLASLPPAPIVPNLAAIAAFLEHS
jgi:ATP-dependent DNA helicase DinG